MTINFSTSPYFDDYDEAKKFLRILYRPGVAVQARELTQMQTILQNQITRFGNHMFKDGAMVIPGQVSYDTAVGYVRLQNLNSGSLSIADFLDEFDGTTITGQTSGVRALVVKTILSESGDPHTLMVKYLDSGTSTSEKTFVDGEEITSNATTPRSATLNALSATGTGTIASVEPGIYYIYGFFVVVDKQTIVLNKYDTTPSYRVGLQAIETLVTPEDDLSLTDNAQGTFNYAAPGAHRYKIELTLDKLAIDSVLDQSFIELLRVKDGQIQYNVRTTEYSVLEKTFARRTYDESGDYTVRPFNIQVREHRNNNRNQWLSNVSYLVGDIVTYGSNIYTAKTAGTSGSTAPVHTSGDVSDGTVTWSYTLNPVYNRGVYTPAEGGDETKLAVGLEPGKAYVQGYEIEKISTNFIDVPKAREYLRVNDTNITATVGNYALIKNLTSIPENVTQFPTVDLYDQLTDVGGTPAGTKIGTARIRGIEKDGNITGDYKIFLFDIILDAGKTFERHVKQFYYNNGTIFDFTADIDPVQTQLTGSITAAGTSVVGTGTKFTTELVVGDYITAGGTTHRVATITDDVTLTLSTSLTVTGSVFYRLSTIVFEQNNASLIFPMSQYAIRSIRSSDDITVGTTYSITRNIGTQTTDGVGQFSINLTTSGETFASTADPDNYLVVKNTDGTIVNPTVSLNLSQTVATFTGLSAATSYTVLAAINKSANSAKEKTKNLVSNSTVDFTTAATATASSLSLSKADIYRIVKIEMATGFGAFNSTGAVDITNRYTLDDGQKTTYYGIGRVILNAGNQLPTGTVRVTFDYFTHGAGDYFSVDSYSGSIQYANIKNFSRDSLDFRPRIDDTGSNFSGTGSSVTSMPKRGIDIRADYSYYLARKDKIALDINGNFFDVQGVSSLKPEEPTDPKLGMVLYKITLAPYTFTTDSNSVYVETLDNKRYTMRDIGKLDKRLENVEYYTALSLLEQETKTLTIPDDVGLDRFKNGFIVDNFEGHGVGDSTSVDYKCSVDMENKELRPFFSMSNVNLLEENTLTSQRLADGYQLTGDLITLPYSSQVFIDQPYASRTENVNPFAIFTFIGTIGMNPPTDEWFEVNRRPDIVINREGNFNTIQTLAEKAGVLGTIWNGWQTQWTGASTTSITRTVRGPWAAGTFWSPTDSFSAADLALIGGQVGASIVTTETTATQIGVARSGVRTTVVAKVDTQTLEDRVLSTAVIPYIRSRNVLFLSRGLKPTTTFHAFFDDTAISSYITPATKISFSTIVGFDSAFDFETNVGGLASESARQIGSNVDSSLNKGDIITGQTSGATAVVALQENTVAGTKALYVVNIKGTFQNGEVIVGSLTGARGTIDAEVVVKTPGSSLVSTANGDLVGLFNIPNTESIRFRTGVREFKLTDSITNGIDFTSQGRQQYRAQGLIETKQATILATRNAEIVQEVVNETATITQTSERVVGDTGWYDPLAQTFLVQQKGGTFITKIDIYFATKDLTGIPVQLQIREVVNGYPGKRVLPFSRTLITPDQITVSSDASVATSFTFASPVYLQDATEYCLVLLSDSNNYNVWISQIGEKAVGTDRFISEQPYAGVLFKSQNASTWTADQLQDLKFTIHRARFNTGSIGQVTFVNDIVPIDQLDDNPLQMTNGSNKVRVYHRNHGLTDGSTVTIAGIVSGTYNNIPSTQLNGNHVVSNTDFDTYVITTTDVANASVLAGGAGITASANKRFDSIQPIVQNQTFSDTLLSFDAKMTSTSYVQDSINVGLVANETNILSDSKTVASQVNETTNIAGNKSFKLNAYLSTTNDSVSPIIDTGRLSVITVNNRISTPSVALNVDPIDIRTIASAVSVIAIDGTNGKITTSDTNMKLQFQTVDIGKYLTISGASNGANNGTFLVTAVAVDGTSITLNATLVTESPSALTVISNDKYISEIAPLNSSGESKYVTKTINLANASTYLRVMFAYNIPQNANVRVFYKSIPVGSASSMSNIEYVEMTGDSPLVVTNDFAQFTDTTFSLKNMTPFNTLVIKLVFESTTTAAIPRIRDFRVIACA